MTPRLVGEEALDVLEPVRRRYAGPPLDRDPGQEEGFGVHRRNGGRRSQGQGIPGIGGRRFVAVWQRGRPRPGGLVGLGGHVRRGISALLQVDENVRMRVDEGWGALDRPGILGPRLPPAPLDEDRLARRPAHQHAAPLDGHPHASALSADGEPCAGDLYRDRPGNHPHLAAIPSGVHVQIDLPFAEEQGHLAARAPGHVDRGEFADLDLHPGFGLQRPHLGAGRDHGGDRCVGPVHGCPAQVQGPRQPGDRQQRAHQGSGEQLAMAAGDGAVRLNRRLHPPQPPLQPRPLDVRGGERFARGVDRPLFALVRGHGHDRAIAIHRDHGSLPPPRRPVGIETPSSTSP